MNNSKNLIFTVLFSSIVGGAITLAGFLFFFQEKRFQSISTEQEKVRFSNFFESNDTSSVIVPEGMNFIASASKVTPAVVHIKTMYEVKESQSGSSNEMDLFREFFGDRFHGGPGFGNPGGKQEASGSGVILTGDGYIVTNNHVIDNADKIEVVLNDKRSYIAKLVGKDPSTDLALLKIEETGLPFVTYGNSDKVKIGEWVLAVGNPFNLTSTVTAGIVSAKARNINILRSKENMAIESFIQTDAAVNPGNSGGALVNLKGELIGINTAIASPSGAFAGYSFAVPVALVKKVMDDLLKYGEVQRGLLGIQIQDMTSELAKEKKIKGINGVYVSKVNDGSAAELAGIKDGDVVRKIGDIEVNSSSELQEQVGRYRPGDKIQVTIERNEKTQTIAVILKNRMGDTNIVKVDTKESASVLGATLTTPSSEELKKLKLSNGVKVNSLTNGKLKDAGIKEGFMIVSIDKNPVRTPNEVVSILSKNKEGGMLIEGYYPNGQKAFYGIGW